MKNRIRPLVTITIDADVLKFYDKLSDELHMSRSKLIENCLAMAVKDLKILKKMGFVEVVKLIDGFQNKFKYDISWCSR
jgi:metal-responsive CopG/Arc/MetJ family transcriptional regulator